MKDSNAVILKHANLFAPAGATHFVPENDTVYAHFIRVEDGKVAEESGNRRALGRWGMNIRSIMGFDLQTLDQYTDMVQGDVIALESPVEAMTISERNEAVMAAVGDFALEGATHFVPETEDNHGYFVKVENGIMTAIHLLAETEWYPAPEDQPEYRLEEYAPTAIALDTGVPAGAIIH